MILAIRIIHKVFDTSSFATFHRKPKNVFDWNMKFISKWKQHLTQTQRNNLYALKRTRGVWACVCEFPCLRQTSNLIGNSLTILSGKIVFRFSLRAMHTRICAATGKYALFVENAIQLCAVSHLQLNIPRPTLKWFGLRLFGWKWWMSVLLLCCLTKSDERRKNRRVEMKLKENPMCTVRGNEVLRILNECVPCCNFSSSMWLNHLLHTENTDRIYPIHSKFRVNKV